MQRAMPLDRRFDQVQQQLYGWRPSTALLLQLLGRGISAAKFLAGSLAYVDLPGVPLPHLLSTKLDLLSASILRLPCDFRKQPPLAEQSTEIVGCREARGWMPYRFRSHAGAAKGIVLTIGKARYPMCGLLVQQIGSGQPIIHTLARGEQVCFFAVQW
jgi:hypothetical protein